MEEIERANRKSLDTRTAVVGDRAKPAADATNRKNWRIGKARGGFVTVNDREFQVAGLCKHVG
jgi:hypothetical protein